MYMYYINSNFHAISLGKNYANTYSVLFCNNKREGDHRTNHQRKWTPIVWSVSLDIVLFYTSIRNYTHTLTQAHTDYRMPKNSNSAPVRTCMSKNNKISNKNTSPPSIPLSQTTTSTLSWGNCWVWKWLGECIGVSSNIYSGIAASDSCYSRHRVYRITRHFGSNIFSF